jgi:hypothetical protein
MHENKIHALEDVEVVARYHRLPKVTLIKDSSNKNMPHSNRGVQGPDNRVLAIAF